MKTSQRIIAAATTALLAVATPAAAHTPALVPPTEQPTEQPAEVQWPPASTHGAFVPAPDDFLTPETLPLCGSEVTVTPEVVEPPRYRALVTEDGDTVVENRGVLTVDFTRASDGATLEDVELDLDSIETLHADGLTATSDQSGPGLVLATDEVEIQALEEAGLPPAFLFLSGRLVGTFTLESAFEPDQEGYPALAEVEIVENTTEYVFDLCDLLDQAAAEGTPAP